MKGFDITHSCEDPEADAQAMAFLANNCYLPANAIIHDLITAYKGRFRVSYSISGTILELFQQHRPDVIESFKKLVKTGCVEIMAETYYHSLSFLHSRTEFRRQVHKHTELVKELFGIEPAIFRNTELIYNNQLAREIADLGFRGILCEGIEKVLRGRAPNHVYTAPGHIDLGLLLRNVRLSDDIAFRFDDHNWNEYPLTADKFAQWLHEHPGDTEIINLMLDYETFGIHKQADSAIFEFLKALPGTVLADTDFIFSTPSSVLNDYAVKDVYDASVTLSWEDRTEASGAWCENMMQNNTIKKIYSLENMVLASGSEKAKDVWGRLQASDYLYYMSAGACQAAAYKFHNPFSTPEEAFRNYTNIVADFEIAMIEREIASRKKQSLRRSFINTIL